ncbi:hypothetical protein A1O7_07431 [Cladophialophora yegresii CBS 114405]|uniref:Cytochrome c oxidase assembly factor 3 n=1 Tax=Cladophialophora yegresii CBS 114405 TaxID=1182544 RepID=W9VMZ4_9EURO|nr:uncharacterized protein A1O7_07431 [Cladophialophora yegresii CBS 114405]EXJ57087.1 hypothetical protein A1O7_07431 [Cladophialophora yegresii CBS 114405]
MHPTLPLQRGLLKRSSYYNPDYRTGAALLRARRPYLVKNTLTGIAIFGFAIGVCMPACLPSAHLVAISFENQPLTDVFAIIVSFTLKAVGQETFDDVIVPSEPQTAAQAIQHQNQSQAVKAKIPTSQVNGMRS